MKHLILLCIIVGFISFQEASGVKAPSRPCLEYKRRCRRRRCWNVCVKWGSFVDRCEELYGCNRNWGGRCLLFGRFGNRQVKCSQCTGDRPNVPENQLNMCRTTAKSCPSNCSGKGSCDTWTGICSCIGGWKGSNCNTVDPGNARNCYYKCEHKGHGNCIYINQVTQGGSNYVNECTSCKSGWFGKFCDQSCDCDGGPCHRDDGICSQAKPISTLVDTCTSSADMHEALVGNYNVLTSDYDLNNYYRSSSLPNLKSKMKTAAQTALTNKKTKLTATVNEVYNDLKYANGWNSDLAFQERSALVDWSVIVVKIAAMILGSVVNPLGGASGAIIKPNFGFLKGKSVNKAALYLYKKHVESSYEAVDNGLGSGSDYSSSNVDQWKTNTLKLINDIDEAQRADLDNLINDMVAELSNFNYNSNSQTDSNTGVLRAFHSTMAIIKTSNFRYIEMVLALQHMRMLALEFDRDGNFKQWKLTRRTGSNLQLGDRLVAKFGNPGCINMGELVDEFVVEGRGTNNQEFVCVFQNDGTAFKKTDCNLEVGCTIDEMQFTGCMREGNSNYFVATPQTLGYYKDGIPLNFQVKKSYRRYRRPGWLAETFNAIIDAFGLSNWIKFSVDVPVIGLGRRRL